jgi:Tfp pilus assembly protein PilX
MRSLYNSNKYMKKNVSDSGQVVLMTLMVLVIATTVGLSLMSRTTTDTAITNQVEQSTRAFNAAEAGIEKALLSGLGTSGATGITGASGVTYTVSVNNVGGSGSGLYQFPKKTQEGATETFWLVNHDDATGQIDETNHYTGTSINVCWSSESPQPALVVTFLFKVGIEYRVAKFAYDPLSQGDIARGGLNNQFPQTSSGIGCGSGTGTAYKETINLSSFSPDVPIALRLRPVYSDAKIVIDTGGNTIPKQGKNILATGTTTSGNNRKISVYEQYRTPATVFDAAIYSQNNF